MTRAKIPFGPLLASILLLVVTACSAFGVVETSDPYRKLEQARNLENRGRLSVAKRLIIEATQIFEQRGDEPGLAEAFRIYAFYIRRNGEDGLYRIQGTGRNPPLSNEDGRMDKSIVYFEKSLRIVKKLNRPDQAANLLLNIGASHHFAGRSPQACAAFDRSLASHEEAVRLRPEMPTNLPRGTRTFRELIERVKAEGKCS